jgi:uncharacterized membrane protein YbhN (UPF0104 family)
LHTPSKKTLIVVSLIVLGVMVLALAAFLLSDISKLIDVFHHLEMIQMIFALLATGTAYLAFTLSFRALFQMTPYRIPFPKFFSIMFISATVNFIISSGGMSSIAIRSFLLKHEKVPYSVTIPLSFAQNMIFNLVLCLFWRTDLFARTSGIYWWTQRINDFFLYGQSFISRRFDGLDFF